MPYGPGKWPCVCTKWDAPLHARWTWTSIRRGQSTWRQIYAVPALCLRRACQLTVPSSRFWHETLRGMTSHEEHTTSANSDQRHKLEESVKRSRSTNSLRGHQQADITVSYWHKILKTSAFPMIRNISACMLFSNTRMVQPVAMCVDHAHHTQPATPTAATSHAHRGHRQLSGTDTL